MIMFDHFVYVFSKHDRDVLLTFGYYLVSSNDKSEVYTFVNNADMQFALNDVKHITSNTLMFDVSNMRR